MRKLLLIIIGLICLLSAKASDYYCVQGTSCQNDQLTTNALMPNQGNVYTKE